MRMGLFSKPPRKRTVSGGNPLTAQQRALLEEEQKVKAQMERCTKLVADAPQIAAELRRKRRDELIHRASMTNKGMGSAKIIDRRFGLEANVAAPAQQKRTRAERRQGRLMFFVLLLTLAGSILYFYYTVTRG